MNAGGVQKELARAKKAAPKYASLQILIEKENLTISETTLRKYEIHKFLKPRSGATQHDIDATNLMLAQKSVPLDTELPVNDDLSVALPPKQKTQPVDSDSSTSTKPEQAKKKKDSKAHQKLESIKKDLRGALESALEKGQSGKWLLPFIPTHHNRPRNPVTGNMYSRGNARVLHFIHHSEEYDSPQWATYKQWEEIGCQVRKGEKGTPTSVPIVFKRCKDNPCKYDGCKKGEKCGKSVSQRRYKLAYLWNADQVEGEVPPIPEEPRILDGVELENVEQVVELFNVLGADVRFRHENSNYYSPNGDYLVLMPPEYFKSVGHAVSTILHEYVHWSGGKERLNRNFGPQGTQEYALEELRAEAGSVFLCDMLGLPYGPRENHDEYLRHYANVLQLDNAEKLIDKAFDDAEKAAEYLYKEIESSVKDGSVLGVAA